MTPTDHYRMFGHYNAWANGRLYDAVAQLTSEQYRADRGAFFKSVHGSLNHLLVTDRIWMQRFTGKGEAPDSSMPSCSRHSRPCAPRARPRTAGSSILSRGSTMSASPERSNTAASHHRKNSSRNWPRRWRIGSITRPTTAARSTRC